MLCVLPTALGMYKFRIKDCAIPLVYYFAVIIVASIASGAVTGYSISAGMEGEDVLMPNYAFTQINPLPFEVPPVLTLNLWGYELNILYILGLYAVYVAIFFAFYGLYRLFLFIRGKVLARFPAKRVRSAKAENGAHYAKDEAAFAAENLSADIMNADLSADIMNADKTLENL